MNVFIEISLIIGIAVIVAGVARVLRQPLIISYIFTGILVGPVFLNLINSSEAFGIFSHMGIALLLFTVGLGLNPKVIKYVGKISLFTGLGQVFFTSVFGFIIGVALGFSVVTALYIAVALTFSSTIIIMKLLSDKKDTETLYGKIAIGFLLVQDIIVIIILMVATSLGEGVSPGSFIFALTVKGGGFVVGVVIVGIFVLPWIERMIARSQEFLLLFAIGWCFGLASMSYYLGFSIEIGALLAGVTLAMSPYRHEINSKMISLRDFFIVIFFILLGSQMEFGSIVQYWPAILIFSAFVLIGNPLIVLTIMGMFGYTKRTSFLAGLTVAQISEFSLIFVAMGISLGHIDKNILSLVTAVGLITIAGSTYLILYSDKIYNMLARYLTIFEKRGVKVDERKNKTKKKHDVILFGRSRIGFDVLKAFDKLKKEISIDPLVIDYNPQTIDKLNKDGYHCKYGDVADIELFQELDIKNVKMIVVTIPDLDTNLLLIREVRKHNQDAVIIIVSHQIDEALELYKAGATYVPLPHLLSGKHIAVMIKKHGLNSQGFSNAGSRHQKGLDNMV